MGAAMFDCVYTLASTWRTCVYDGNLTVLMFEPKRARAMILCLKHHLLDLYRFCTKDAPGIMTGPVSGLRHLYVEICQALLRKSFGYSNGLDLW